MELGTTAARSRALQRGLAVNSGKRQARAEALYYKQETHVKTKRVLCFVLLVTALVCAPSAPGGILGPRGDDAEEKKVNVRKDRDKMLADLYSSNPELKAKIQGAVGYATFKNLNINLLLLATANGYGMVVENKTGKETFMRMASLGGGVGAGSGMCASCSFFTMRA
jgi:hypothetical protein